MKKILKKIRDRFILNAIRSIVVQEAERRETKIFSSMKAEMESRTVRLFSDMAKEADKRETEILSSMKAEMESRTVNLFSGMEKQKTELAALWENSFGLFENAISENKRECMEFIRSQHEDLLKQYKNDLVKLIPNFISGAFINHAAFSPFKNFCKNRELVVCGAGPSLKDYIPIKNAVHIALNRAFLFGKVDFDFIYAQDFTGIKMVQNELAAYRPEACVKFFGTQDDRNLPVYQSNIPFQLVEKCKARLFVTNYFAIDNLWDSKFIYNIDTSAISTFTNVGLAVMQFALWMNPKRIFLVGIDASGNHFTQQGLSAEEKIEEEQRITAMWESERERTRKKWEECKLFASIYYPETEIVSVNPVGLKGIFRDVYQTSGKTEK